MKISKIQIFNYRLLKNITIDVEDDLSLIIGKNNCGKTSFLSILNKFIGDRSDNNYFSYDDFNLDFRNILYKSIVKDYDIWNYIKDKGISMYLYIDYNDKDDLSNINQLMLDLEPDNKKIVLKFEYYIDKDMLSTVKKDYREYIKRHISKSEDNDIKQKQNVAIDTTKENSDIDLNEDLFRRFMNKNHKKYFKLYRKSVLYNCKTQKINEENYIDIDVKNKSLSNKINLKNIINFHYIDARRLVTNNDKDHTLSNQSSNYYERTGKNIQENEVLTQFENAIDTTDNELTNIYDKVFNTVIQKVKKFGGIKENETVIKIMSTISTQQLLNKNTTVVYEDNNNKLPENYNGLGYLNLISMIFEVETILSDFRRDNEKTRPADINLLFIEEPEAHTHPQMQYIFIKNIKKLLNEGKNGSDNKTKINLQTIMSTHSSHIVSASEFDDIKYFCKIKYNEDNYCYLNLLNSNDANEKINKENAINLCKESNKTIRVISKNLKDLEIKYKKEGGNNNHYKFLKQYLTLNRSEIFFADKAILIEGDTERILIPAMMKKIDDENIDNDNQIPLLSQNISIIEVGNYSQIFDEFIKFIGIKVLIITDIDSAQEEKKIDKKGVQQTDYKACAVDIATHTTNYAIKHYLKSLLGKNGKKSEIQLLTSLDRIKKIQELNNTNIQQDNESSWLPSEKGKLMIVYQTKEKDCFGIEYNARSFEDAFININIEFIEKNKNVFQGLKNRKKISKNKKFDSYIIATECIDGKTSFAMDILLNSEEEDGKAFSNWKIPKYIEEGLLWLKEN